MIDDHSGFDVPSEYVGLEMKRRYAVAMDAAEVERLTALTQDLQDTYGHYNYLAIAWRERVLVTDGLSAHARVAGMLLAKMTTLGEGAVIPESKIVEHGLDAGLFRSGRRELAEAGWLDYDTQGYREGEATYDLKFPHLSPG